TAGVQPRAQAALDAGAAISGSPLGVAPSPGAGGASAGLTTTGSAGSGAAPAGASQPSASAPPPAATARPGSAPAPFRAGPNDVYLHPLHRGARVIAGTVLGHVGTGPGSAAAGEAGPRMLFQIRPAGPGAPLIDPKPILDGWVQLENTSVYRASGANRNLASEPSAGQVLLESKAQLQLQVLANR